MGEYRERKRLKVRGKEEVSVGQQSSERESLGKESVGRAENENVSLGRWRQTQTELRRETKREHMGQREG